MTRGPSRHVPDKMRAAVLSRDNHQCVVCGSTEDLELDHITPIARGGVSVESNLQVLCAPHNNAKGDRLDDERMTWFDRDWFKPEAIKS